MLRNRLRNKLKNKVIRKLTKVGKRSYAVVLPKEAIKSFGWKERQKLIVKINRKRKAIIIQDWEKEKK